MARSAQEWFDEYSASHRNPTNKLLHWICVPVIVLSVIGLLWALPVPTAFRVVSPLLNWGTLVVAGAIAYYFTMSFNLGIGMLTSMLVLTWLVSVMDQLAVPLWVSCSTLFVVAWIGQFIGHAVEGKRPSFFKDVQFLMIGPLWLLAHLYRRAGIPF
jgi:uncharacterized membrane protein YGL010W